MSASFESQLGILKLYNQTCTQSHAHAYSQLCTYIEIVHVVRELHTQQGMLFEVGPIYGHMAAMHGPPPTLVAQNLLKPTSVVLMTQHHTHKCILYHTH